MKNTILDSIKLELPSNHQLNEFTKHIKENNRPECLGSIISRFIWLRYNDRNQLLKVSRPMLQQKICISHRENVYSTGVIGKNKLGIPPSDMIRT